MPEFSNRSMERLSECHDDLVTLFTTVVQDYDCVIICGHRDMKSQREAFTSNKSEVDWPKSKHNHWPSNAVDVSPYPIDWNDIGSFYIFTGWVLATANRLLKEGKMSHRLRTGADWDMDGKTTDQKFNDLVHFELI